MTFEQFRCRPFSLVVAIFVVGQYCLFLSVLAWPASAVAIESFEGSMADKRSGLSFTLKSVGIRKSGYRVVELTLSRNPPYSADRTVYVNVQPHNRNSYGLKSPSVQTVMDIPQGAARVHQRVLIPSADVWNYISVSFSENGDQIRRMGRTFGSNQSNDDRITETFPGWWFIDGDFEAIEQAVDRGDRTSHELPNVRAMLAFMPYFEPEYELLTQRDFQTFDHEILKDLEKLTTVNMTGFSQLPTNWLEYTCYDILVIAYDDLTRLIAEHPAKWEALRTFVRQGASMVVYGVGALDGDAPDLDFARLTKLGKVLDPNGDHAGWETPNDQDYHTPLSDLLPNVVYHTRQGQYRARGVGPPMQNQYASFADSSPPANSVMLSESFDGDDENADGVSLPAPRPGFRLRSYGLGQVAAISSFKPFRLLRSDDRGQRQWAWLLQSLKAEQIMWYQRHGLSWGRRNPDFWNFLLKGVGAAPVLQFLVLITAFVIVIGPVNYYYLRRSNRLYLLLFTVPACAALITIGLLGYAFFSDGISTRMRLRSFTLVDADHEEAYTWSRQSYYAGLPPSEGLMFSKDAAIFPIVYAPDEADNHDQRLSWQDEHQILAKGYLRTRTVAQMMVCQPFHTQSQIDIRRTPTMSATNEFDFDVDLLVAIDPEKNTAYVAQSVAAGATVELEESTYADARKLTARWLDEHDLEIPEGVDFGYQTGRYWNEIDSDSSPTYTSTSLLERSIAELRFNGTPKQFVYYALTHKGHSLVPKGAADSTEEDGFHVLKGFWTP